MSATFWSGALLLLVLAAVFLFLPGLFLRRRGEGNASTNRDWFLRREVELGTFDSGVDEGVKDELLNDARLRLLEDSNDDAGAGSETGSAATAGPSPIYLATGLGFAILLLSVALYGKLGAGADVALKAKLEQFPADGSEADYRRLMLAVEDRAAARPDNLYYQAMLGNFYMDEGDFARARELYRSLAEVAPNDAGAAARAAQAGFLAAGRKLSPEDQLLAERALSIDPHQRTALGLLGMVAYEQGEYRAAISYWRRLLVMENPDSSSAEMIRGVIARAEAALSGNVAAVVPPHGQSPGSPAAAAPIPSSSAPTPSSADASGMGVTLRLELAQGARAAPGDTVFVFARNPALDTRMPVAVKRLSAGQLPVTLRLDDASSMAGQKISELSLVDVVARVSPSGQPGEQHATLQASLSDLPPGAGEEIHTLVLRPVAEPAGDS